MHLFFKSKSFVFIMIFLVIFTLVGCSEPVPRSVDKKDKLIIYTSIYPLYYFTKEIVGEKGEVINLIPAGTDPHDFEPTIQDIMQLSEADLFVYNGRGFESWIGRMVDAVNDPDIELVDSTENIFLETNDIPHKDNLDEVKHYEHDGHHHGDDDPHVWVDPNLAKLQAEIIKNVLIATDQKNSQYYEENFKQVADKLEALDTQFKELAEHAKRRDFVVSHEAFGHLASRYALNQVAITGLNLEEPSTKQVQEIIRFIKENRIEYILFENMVIPKVAEVIQMEVGATSLVLHNLEGLTEEELAQGKDYFSIMKENLDVLKTALGYRQ